MNTTRVESPSSYVTELQPFFIFISLATSEIRLTIFILIINDYGYGKETEMYGISRLYADKW